MKTRTFRIDWLIPVLGIALVGGGYFAMKSYLGFQEQTRCAEQCMATLDRFWEDCALSRILMQAHESGCAMTARSVDGLLSEHLATDNPLLASGDPGTRALVEVFTKWIDRRRSQSAPMAGDVPAGRSNREVAGQSIPTQTLASASPGK